jgi:hypothetical protein
MVRVAELGASELLAAWESGQDGDDLSRAAMLHTLARPQAGRDELLASSIGRRDTDLLLLHAGLFGDRIGFRIGCTGCAEELEFELSVQELLASTGSPAPAADAVTAAGWNVRFRPPTVADLQAAALEAQLDPEAARGTVLARCVLESLGPDGAAHPVGELPAEVRRALSEAMATADPQADLRLNVPCGACGHRTKAILDVVGDLWSRLDAWARDLLLDVHLLASSYGWREPDVLALSPLRRRFYLELAGHA